MNRRNFLQALAATPVIPYVPALPTSVTPCVRRFVDPPLIVQAAEPVEMFSVQYRQEFIAAFEQRQHLLRNVIR